MNDIFDSAKDALNRAAEKAAPVAEDVKEKLTEAAAEIKEKAAPIVEDVKEKVDELKEKAAPVIEKVKDGVEDAVEKVKDGAEKIGELFTPDAPGLNVKNELFDQLGEEVKAQKEAAKNKAGEMQRMLEEMMKGTK